MSGRLIAVSNRVALPRAGENQAGGLAVAIQRALAEHGGIWFGWNGRIGGDPEHIEHSSHDGIDYLRVPLTGSEHEHYYLGYANRVLWPVFHLMPMSMCYSRTDYNRYRAVNRRFAAQLAAVAEPGDRFWIHDYHLIPLGEALREQGLRQPLGFFLHIPFPPYQVLRALPDHRALLSALCRYDLVGFQTEADREAFLDAAHHALGATVEGGVAVHGEAGRTATVVCPVGVAVDELAALAAHGRDSRRVRRRIDGLYGRLIIGVERLDYTKGLRARLAGYERFLERHPDRRGKVVFMQVATPSRTEIPDYRDLRHEVEGMAGHINGRYAEFNWVPVHYLHRSFARASLMGFYRHADAALVTALRDGMNLVAKEFVAAQDRDDPGVLILSELAGAAQELDAALLINPFDIDTIAEALEQALSMPLAERRERHQAMLGRLRASDLRDWHGRFLTALDAAASGG
ncbi:alpha,alpha-trehalose-phosphate synthase (UDP-forming) [Arhodomonas sp. SL1]|uniref:alpha,alpha-trehalose-phosphate synthase (UDP-forming) n=1 Tax=Arhodomonas sp. SL1 TaxID=3425691 RepID=UPI003F88168D